MGTRGVRRATLAREVTLAGHAVRTHGGAVALRLAPGDEGLVFVRDDTGARYRAALEQVVPVPNCTALGADGAPAVLFVEHVLSALVGLDYTDAEIHVDGAEVPLLDGSALPLVTALADVGRTPLDGELAPLSPTEPVVVGDGARSLALLPADAWSADYTLVHPHPLIGEDRLALNALDSYATAIAPARTFATVEELAALRDAGLLKGGSEADLLVVHPDRLSSPLRLAHEFAAHKLLDLIGDLALVGAPVVGCLVARRTGHADNQALARALRAATGWSG